MHWHVFLRGKRKKMQVHMTCRSRLHGNREFDRNQFENSFRSLRSESQSKTFEYARPRFFVCARVPRGPKGPRDPNSFRSWAQGAWGPGGLGPKRPMGPIVIIGILALLSLEDLMAHGAHKQGRGRNVYW